MKIKGLSMALIKDNKKPKNGVFPMRLIVPVTNFTSAFPNIRHCGIRKSLMTTKLNT